MRYRAYAKINLTLEIVGKRPDGYHDLASLVHTVSLADELRLEPADSLLTRVEGPAIDHATNLVTRAAQRLAAALGEPPGASLSLVKRIPLAAGLGGGSADAATTLVGLNALWRAHLSTHTLSELAAELGSDVPFFIRGGAAVMRGRGDQLAPLPARTDQWLVLVVPPHTLVDKTRRLYAALEPGDFSDGAMTERAAERLVAGQPLDEYELVNGFERAARRVFPGLDQMWRSVEALAKRRFFLSGAGPAVFALAASRDDARQTVGRLSQVAASTYAVRTVKHARASLRRSPIEYP